MRDEDGIYISMTLFPIRAITAARWGIKMTDMAQYDFDASRYWRPMRYETWHRDFFIAAINMR